MAFSVRRPAKAVLSSAAGALALAAGAANASPLSGLTYIAASDIVGKFSTATIAGGGNPLYLANAPQYRGVVGISFFEGSSEFVCSGSLSADRMSVITAGHCGIGVNASTAKVYFSDPNLNPTDVPIYNAGAPGVTTVGVSHIYVNPTYAANRRADPGDVIDDNDIAVYRLASPAPAFANGYNLYTGADLTGVGFNTAGYGVRSDAGGSVGADLGTGRLRQGDNTYVFRLGDPDFGGFFNGFFGNGEVTNSYIAELDDGTTNHDQACQLGLAFGGSPGKYCNLGPVNQVITAPGDSGGPQFVNGELASITSFGLTFGTDLGDIDNNLNSTFGELAGYVPVYNNLGFLNHTLNPPRSQNRRTGR